MKTVVAAFNQEKALVGAFSVIVQLVVEPMEHYTALLLAVAGLGVITPVINDINWPGFCLPPIRKCGCVGGGAGAGHQSDTHLPIQQGGGRLWHLPLHTLKCDHNVHTPLVTIVYSQRYALCTERSFSFL